MAGIYKKKKGITVILNTGALTDERYTFFGPVLTCSACFSLNVVGKVISITA